MVNPIRLLLNPNATANANANANNNHHYQRNMSAHSLVNEPMQCFEHKNYNLWHNLLLNKLSIDGVCRENNYKLFIMSASEIVRKKLRKLPPEKKERDNISTNKIKVHK